MTKYKYLVQYNKNQFEAFDHRNDLIEFLHGEPLSNIQAIYEIQVLNEIDVPQVTICT